MFGKASAPAGPPPAAPDQRLEDIKAARATQRHAREADDVLLEMAATGRIDRWLDAILSEREHA